MRVFPTAHNPLSNLNLLLSNLADAPLLWGNVLPLPLGRPRSTLFDNRITAPQKPTDCVGGYRRECSARHFHMFSALTCTQVPVPPRLNPARHRCTYARDTFAPFPTPAPSIAYSTPRRGQIARIGPMSRAASSCMVAHPSSPIEWMTDLSTIDHNLRTSSPHLDLTPYPCST